MIVNKSVLGIHIIFHEAHGLLAGKIAHHIHPKYRPLHWFETLIAICEHDDRQLNFSEKNYLSEIGVPLDFTEEKEEVNAVITRMRRILKSSQNKSLWVKLLISYHLEFIYSHLEDKSVKIKTFFEEEHKERKKILKEFNISDRKARAYYEVMRFCDRLSLILCKDETPSLGRLLEINTSINGDTFFIKKDEKGSLIISPWVFETEEIKLSVEERIIKEAQFKSNKDFEAVLLHTNPNRKEWVIKKGS